MRVVILGAGFAGLGAAMRLKQAGFTDFVILERADEVGGVWRDNAYPGAACDVESHLYSFTDLPHPEWTRLFATQPEIWAYLRNCADRCGLRPHLRLRHEVRSADWDAAAGEWRLDTAQGEFCGAALVLAGGALSEPAVPALPGLERFDGPAFHSARWDADFDPAGRRVAVVGTGASAVQFVPHLQPRAAQLTVFQRTPPWVLPGRDRAIGPRERDLFRRFPAVQQFNRRLIRAAREMLVIGFQHPALMRLLEGAARRHLEASIADPVLRRRLLPDYRLGCKRILLSSTYYPALAQPNVAVVTAPIAEVRARSVLDGGGGEHSADALIFGTGFQVTDFPLARRVRGREARTLSEAWAGSPRAHLGTTVAGFPNLFLLQGPNTGLGHTSVLLMIEAQIEHLVGALRHLAQTGAAAVEPRPEAQAAFVAEVDARMRGTVWTAGGCRSWYLDAAGRNAALWPGTTAEFHRRVARFRPEEYALFPPAPVSRAKPRAIIPHEP